MYDKFGNDETDTDVLAQLLGYASKTSGTFYTKIKDMQTYGLIVTGGRGKYRVTDLGKRITWPTSKEEGDQATKEALLNVPLWNALYAKFGTKLPPENLWVDISKIAQVDLPVAKQMEPFVRSAYLEDITRMPTGTSPEQKSFMPPEVSRSMEIPAAVTTTNEGMVEVPFGKKYSVKYPAKMNPKQAFEQIKKYMQIYIEEFETEESNVSSTGKALEEATDDQKNA